MEQTFSKKIYHSTKLVTLVFLAALMIGGFSCKSKKKAAEASDAAAEKARIEQEARQRELAEEERRRAEEERLAQERAERNAPATKLATYFSAIANSTSVTSANQTINEALALFSSPEAPVLIVISESNGQKDYDRPTTIREYLNYLKDQRKNVNRISDVQVDDAGRITELELVKK